MPGVMKKRSYLELLEINIGEYIEYTDKPYHSLAAATVRYSQRHNKKFALRTASATDRIYRIHRLS